MEGIQNQKVEFSVPTTSKTIENESVMLLDCFRMNEWPREIKKSISSPSRIFAKKKSENVETCNFSKN